MTPEVLRQLAEEVERLEGPNRNTHLEWRIEVALGRPVEAIAPVRPYTSSLDAAASLMPEVFRVAAVRQLPPEESGWQATAWKPPPRNMLENARGATEPLARTAAALRARAALIEALPDTSAHTPGLEQG